MTFVPRRRWKVAVGIAVLGVAAVVLAYVIGCPWPRGQRNPGAAVAMPAQQPAAVPALQLGGAAVADPRTAAAVRGIVRFPDGTPASGASVTLHRAHTAWPEWAGDLLDNARTGADGTFQFRVDSLLGLHVEFSHPQFAGGAVEVPWRPELLELRLEPGFELVGLVTNDVGAPVPNARVALESVPGEERRVAVTTTGANGRYAFKNRRAGPVRLVARHESWQAVVDPTVVIGSQLRVDLRCERPAMAPLRGRVVAAATQAPIADALVQLLPLNQQVGLCDPISARTGADGMFLLTGLPRGNLRLFVRHADHGSLPASTLLVGEFARDLLIELPARSAVSGQLVVDDATPPWRGGEVLELVDFAGQIDHAVVAADGSFRFAESMSPGKATLRLLDRQFAFQRTRTIEESILIEESAANVLELAVVQPTVVRGRVVDSAGRPLAGAQVIQVKVFAESARTITEAAGNFDPTTFAKSVAQLFGSDRDELLATTAADGTFEIRGSTPGSDITVRFVARGQARLQRRLRVPGNQQPAELGEVRLPAAGRLQGRVHRGDRGIGGVSVTLLGREAQAIVTSDGSGRWSVDELVPGRYRVIAKLPLGASEQLVDVPAGTTTSVDMAIEAGRTVRGVVVGSGGRPLPGAIVSVRGALAGTSTTDDAGAFVLDLPPRAAALQVAWGDRNRAQSMPLGAGDAPLRLQLETPPVCTLRAKVAGLPGQIQLPGGLLRLAVDGAGPEQRRSHWVEFVDGELRWPFCPVGRVRIEIVCDGFQPFVTERDLAADDDVVLDQVWLEPGARLLGLAVDAAGNPVANAVALLGEESDLDLFEARTRTGADGTFRLSGVSARSAQLVVRAPGFAPSVVELQLPFDVLADQPKRVVLERGSTIKVAAGAGREGTVQLRRDGRVLATSDIDVGGFAWFPNRAAGVYTVQLDGERAVKSVVVEPGAAIVTVGL